MLRASLLANARILPQARRGSYFFNRIGRLRFFANGSYGAISDGQDHPVCRSNPMQTTGQVECKRLISTNAIDWSVTMQMGGQVHAITQAHIKNRRTTTRPWKATGLQGLPALPIGARFAPKIRLTASRTSAKPEPYKRCPRQHPGSQNL